MEDPQELIFEPTPTYVYPIMQWVEKGAIVFMC
jgi:hypothetical protein